MWPMVVRTAARHPSRKSVFFLQNEPKVARINIGFLEKKNPKRSHEVAITGEFSLSPSGRALKTFRTGFEPDHKIRPNQAKSN